jgi:hypothetical protein
MKHVGSLTKAISFLLIALSTVAVVHAEPARVSVHEVNGSAKCLIAGTWRTLEANMMLRTGDVIKTAADTTVDLLLLDSGTAIRVMPDSELHLERLEVMKGTDATSTRLRLVSGSMIGAQRKLGQASAFEVKTATTTARIVGTEYLVRADGAVTVLDGSVSLNYNLPGNGGSVKVEVAAGFSFNPATGQVVPTSPDFLKDIIAHVNTVKNNAQVFKVSGGATLVVKAEKEHMSPVHPGDDNGQGDDNNGQGGNDNGNDNGQGNGSGNGNGNGKGH